MGNICINFKKKTGDYNLEVHGLYQDISKMCNGDKDTINTLITRKKQAYPTKTLPEIYRRVLVDLEKIHT